MTFNEWFNEADVVSSLDKALERSLKQAYKAGEQQGRINQAEEYEGNNLFLTMEEAAEIVNELSELRTLNEARTGETLLPSPLEQKVRSLYAKMKEQEVSKPSVADRILDRLQNFAEQLEQHKKVSQP